MLFKKIIIVCLTVFSGINYALDLELTQGINSALPIAINSFGSDPIGQELTTIVNDDLRLSGQFKIISPSAQDGQLSVALSRGMGADSLLTGRANKIGSNRYDISFELLDAVAQGRSLLDKSFQVSGNDVRSLAHHISDLVYEKLTGERGVFSTRIAYVLVQRSGGMSRYSLEVADADGYNPQSLVVSSEPIMSPAWSPDGHQIAYVSFEKRKAQIFIISVENGKRRLVTDFTGMNNAPSWSIDGSQLAVVLSKGGNPKIYSVDLASGNLKQLTFGQAIDTEPRFSPDGHSLLFTSGRGGSPQIYRLNLADGNVSRVTYEGNYNARATYTPNQKNIIMFHKEENGRFNIAVQDTDNGHVTPLTFATLDDSPSLSPNGRLIIYGTRHNDQGVLGIVSIDGRIRMRLPARQGDVQEPSWSPYLG